MTEVAEKRTMHRAAQATGLLLLVGLIVWSAKGLDLRSVTHAMRSTDLGLLTLAAVANLIALAIQAWRWNCLLRPVGPATYGSSLGAMVIGFAMSSVLPARAGEVARVHLAARRMRVGNAAVAGSTLLDHVLNGVTIAPLALVLPFAPGLPNGVRHAIMAVLVLALTGGLLAWTIATPRRSDEPPRGRLRILIAELRFGFAAMRSPGLLSKAAAIGILAWMLEVLTTWLALMASGLGTDPTVAVVTLIAVNMALAIPAPPGNLGTFEVGAVLALTALGYPKEQALAFALCYHLLQLVPLWLAGGIAWLWMRRSDEAVPAESV
jgi:hypothetical protein